MNAVEMGGDQIEDDVPHFFPVTIAVEVFNARSRLDTVVFVGIESGDRRKWTTHSYARQHEVARTAGAEVEVPGLVQEDVDTVVHRIDSLGSKGYKNED